MSTDPPFNCTCAGGEHDLAHAADCPVRIAHESDRYANHPFTTSPERAIEPPSDAKWDGCPRCGEDRPWTMVVDPTGHAVALCAECIDMLTPQWSPWVGTEPFDA